MARKTYTNKKHGTIERTQERVPRIFYHGLEHIYWSPWRREVKIIITTKEWLLCRSYCKYVATLTFSSWIVTGAKLSMESTGNRSSGEKIYNFYGTKVVGQSSCFRNRYNEFLNLVYNYIILTQNKIVFEGSFKWTGFLSFIILY